MITRELCIYKFNELLTGLNKSIEDINFDDTDVLSLKIENSIYNYAKEQSHIRGIHENIDDKNFKRIDEMVQAEKLLVTPLAYIRGRSLQKIFFIVDEAQNLTPHEVKTIISRAGENTKIVFTGDIHQIDTPYLDAQSNGLSYLIDKVKNQPLFAHITLQRGERSELANLANELL